MKSPKIPGNEASRMRDLLELNLLIFEDNKLLKQCDKQAGF